MSSEALAKGLRKVVELDFNGSEIFHAYLRNDSKLIISSINVIFYLFLTIWKQGVWQNKNHIYQFLLNKMISGCSHFYRWQLLLDFFLFCFPFKDISMIFSLKFSELKKSCTLLKLKIGLCRVKDKRKRYFWPNQNLNQVPFTHELSKLSLTLCSNSYERERQKFIRNTNGFKIDGAKYFQTRNCCKFINISQTWT